MMVAILRGLAVPRSLMLDGKVVVLAFAATLFMSALLLFSIQPVFAKLVLPKLGGAPAVWAVSLCFFQAALLAGYTYAFILNRWLDDGRAIAVHLALMACTCFALPVGFPVAFAEPPSGEAYLWLMGLLSAGVGLPFFTSNAPLLQAWFSRTGNRHACGGFAGCLPDAQRSDCQNYSRVAGCKTAGCRRDAPVDGRLFQRAVGPGPAFVVPGLRHSDSGGRYPPQLRSHRTQWSPAVAQRDATRNVV
jgi:hypothetical protein